MSLQSCSVSCFQGVVIRGITVAVFFHVVLVCSPAVALVPQLQFSDLKAGYEENLAKISAMPIRIVYRIDDEEFADTKEAWKQRDIRWYEAMLNSGEFSSDERTEIKRLLAEKSALETTGARKITTVSVHRNQSGMILRLMNDEHESDADLPGRIETVSRFSDDFTPFHESSYFSLFWDRVSNQTCVASSMHGFRSFGILPGYPSEQQVPGFRGSPYSSSSISIDSFKVNAPIDLDELTTEGHLFSSWSHLPYYWDPPGEETRTVALSSDSTATLVVSTEWLDMETHPGIQQSGQLRCLIDLERGFLPTEIVSLHFYRKVSDGQVFSMQEEDGKPLRIKLELDKLGDAFFCVRSKFESFATAPELPVNREFVMDINARLLHSWQPGVIDSGQNWIRRRAVMVEVIDISRWDSGDGSVFRPECPPGVRYSNPITGETRLERESIKTLELDLKAGERPIHDGFTGPEDGVVGMDPRFRIPFWFGIALLGVMLVWILNSWLGKKTTRGPGETK